MVQTTWQPPVAAEISHGEAIAAARSWRRKIAGPARVVDTLKLLLAGVTHVEKLLEAVTYYATQMSSSDLKSQTPPPRGRLSEDAQSVVRDEVRRFLREESAVVLMEEAVESNARGPR